MTAVSYASRATDQRATYLRIYADPDGETHMEDIDVPLLPTEIFKGYPPLRLSETLAASGCRFCRVPEGLREVGWHNPPCRKLVIGLTCEVEFETSDGDIRCVAAGSVVLAEDTTGKGHISRHPPDGQLLGYGRPRPQLRGPDIGRVQRLRSIVRHFHTPPGGKALQNA